MSTVILAEKPKQAKDYADCFKRSTALNGAYKVSDPLFSDETIITYGVGHLVDLISPDQYNEKWKTWSLENLPIFPDKFRYEVSKDKKAQFSIVRKYLKEADTIVIATDCGREGESIAWSIINFAGVSNKGKTFKRLWINSLEKDVIYQGFQNLKPAEDYYPSFKEAQSRQFADWLIGMNASPLYSLELQKRGIKEGFSVGRVQTPTLYMIYDLQNRIQAFKKEKYFEGKSIIETGKGNFESKLDPNEPFSTQEEFETYLFSKGSKLGKQNGQILSVIKEDKTKQSPRLFSLSSLQSTMNKQMKAGAKETLVAVQGLYEAKLLSYPRTDSPCITINEHKYLIDHLNEYKSFIGAEDIETNCFTPNVRYVNSEKVSDHHAIIPTKKVATKEEIQKFSPLQQAIYEKVVRVTVAMFAEKYQYEETIIQTTVDLLKLKASGRVPKKMGWRDILQDQPSEGILPEVVEGETVKVDLEAVEKETQPPAPYTEGTLITAMKTAGKTVDDEEAQVILKEVEGIGTESTRAEIIETLKRKQYITVEKNKLVVTAKGKILCKAVEPEGLLTSAELTAKWESYLKRIGSKQGTQEAFLMNIKKFIVHLLEVVPGQLEEVDLQAETSTITEAKNQAEADMDLGVCPKCKTGHVRLFKKVAACSNDQCEFKIWLNLASKTLTKNNLKQLVSKGRTSAAVKGFTGKKGKFDAIVVLKNDFTLGFEFTEGKRKNEKHNIQAKRN